MHLSLLSINESSFNLKFGQSIKINQSIIVTIQLTGCGESGEAGATSARSRAETVSSQEHVCVIHLHRNLAGKTAPERTHQRRRATEDNRADVSYLPLQKL